jgi:uncharacterized membrane protein YoaK (UPF0700 family)
MLIREGESRSPGIDIGLAISLAAIAGAINAATFRAAGFFSGNMTGNVSSVSDYTAAGSWGLAATFLAIVVTFILGAFSSTLVIRAAQRRGIRGVFALVILGEGFFVAIISVVDLLMSPHHGTPLLVLGLAFLMGVQNAASTLISNWRVRTTHVSGTATDIGIELALILGAAEVEPGVRARFRLHALTLLAFLLGGVAGVAAYLGMGDAIFVISGLALMVLASPFVLSARRSTA